MKATLYVHEEDEGECIGKIVVNGWWADAYVQGQEENNDIVGSFLGVTHALRELLRFLKR